MIKLQVTKPEQSSPNGRFVPVVLLPSLLTYADITDAETEKTLTLNTSDAKKVSAFIWSDFENLTPYADSYSEPIEAVSE